MNKRQIVIAPKNQASFLLKKLRMNNPFVDLKFMSKEDLIHDFYGAYDTDALIYLISKHHLSFELAKTYLANLLYASFDSNNSKITELSILKKELLDNGLLVSNKYLSFEFSKRDVFIYGYDKDDSELTYILDSINAHYSFVDCYASCDKTIDVLNFFSVEEELFFVFNKISQLIHDGVNAKNIYLLGLDKDYQLPFKRMKENYGLYFNESSSRKMISSPLVNVFINYLSLSGDAIKSLDDTILQFAGVELIEKDVFVDLVMSYNFSSFNLDEKIRLYRDLFKNKVIPNVRYNEAISVISSLDAFPNNPNDYLFIVGFNQGKFPSIKRDNDYLTDEEKEKMHLLTSSLINQITKRKLINSIKSTKNLFISYRNHSLDSSLFPSPLIKELKMNVINTLKIDEVYSKEEALLKHASFLDKKRKYLAINPEFYAYANTLGSNNYMSYDYHFNGVHALFENSSLFLSYSSIKTFYLCQFRYYLDKVLKIADNKETFEMHVGNVCHRVLETMDSPNSSFEVEFSKAKSEYVFSKREETLLARVKDELRETYKLIKTQQSEMINPTIYREREFRFQIDNNALLVGKIDKVVVTGENKQYVSLIDYKSGPEEFKEKMVPFGLSLQLPTYSLLIKNDKELEHKQLIGLYIQGVLANKLETNEKNRSDHKKQILLDGKSINNVNALKTFDMSISYDEESSYINKVTTSPEGDGFSKSSHVADENWFNSIGDAAFIKYKEAINKIRGNDFIINPKQIGGNETSCRYCPYIDICHQKESDVVILEKEEEESDE